MSCCVGVVPVEAEAEVERGGRLAVVACRFMARMVAAVPHSVPWQALEVVAFAVNCTSASMLKTLAEARQQPAATTVRPLTPCAAHRLATRKLE